MGASWGIWCLRVVAQPWGDRPETVQRSSGDRAPNKDMVLEPGWLDMELPEPRPLCPTSNSVLQDMHQR